MHLYQIWKDNYERYLKIMYRNFIYLCYKHNRYKHVNWKDNYNYELFCKMIYES